MVFLAKIRLHIQHLDIRWVICGIFVVTVAYAFFHRIAPLVDARAYDAIAVNLLEGYGYREHREVSVLNDLSIVRAGPGYQFFLLTIYTLFGHRYEMVWILQAVMHALSAWMLYSIACRLWQEKGKRIGLITACLYGFWPDLIEIAAMLMTETLYLFLTVASLYVFVRLTQMNQRMWVWAAALGVITACGILTRPLFILFVPVYLFFFGLKKQWFAAGICLIFLAVPMIPWIARNFTVYHQLIPTTLIGSYNLWLGNTPTATGGQFFAENNPLDAYLAAQGARGLKEHASTQFFAFVSDSPLLFAKLCFLRVIRFFSLIRPMGFWFYQTGLPQLLFVCLSGCWIAAVSVFGVIGLRQAWRTSDRVMRLLVCMAIMVPLPLLLTVVQSRYRFQVYPFLALGAGYAITLLRQKGVIVWRSNRVVWSTAMFFLIITMIDVFYFLPTVMEHLHRLFS